MYTTGYDSPAGIVPSRWGRAMQGRSPRKRPEKKSQGENILRGGCYLRFKHLSREIVCRLIYLPLFFPCTPTVELGIAIKLVCIDIRNSF